MGAAAIPAIFMVGSAVAGAAASYSAAKSANKAFRTGIHGEIDANAANAAYRKEALASQKSKLAKNFSRYLGASSVSAADRNVGSGGSTRAAEVSSFAQALEDQRNLELNKKAADAAADSQLRAEINRLASGYKPTFASGLGGGLQGLATGAQLTGAVGGFA